MESTMALASHDSRHSRRLTIRRLAPPWDRPIDLALPFLYHEADSSNCAQSPIGHAPLGIACSEIHTRPIWPSCFPCRLATLQHRRCLSHPPYPIPQISLMQPSMSAKKIRFLASIHYPSTLSGLLAAEIGPQSRTCSCPRLTGPRSLARSISPA